jgi:hypothetical protein
MHGLGARQGNQSPGNLAHEPYCATAVDERYLVSCHNMGQRASRGHVGLSISVRQRERLV